MCGEDGKESTKKENLQNWHVIHRGQAERLLVKNSQVMVFFHMFYWQGRHAHTPPDSLKQWPINYESSHVRKQ